jgi:uroporphyrin-III C-methyltransferase
MSPGQVSLVGAGPGDPELLTLKALDRLARADIVLFDRLVDQRILDRIRPGIRMTGVGKDPAGPSWSQTAINDLMIHEARRGAFVVRLKSGDPLLFGRADDEIAALTAADIPFEIVPGISSATAAAAAAGFSLTRRGRNQAVAFLTARDANGFAEHEWRHLARAKSALALFMGVRAAHFVQGRLMMHGAAPETPITVVENASRRSERIITGRLDSLASLLRANGIKSPAIIFIGLTRGTADLASSLATAKAAYAAAT